jgi:hypothetical protein
VVVLPSADEACSLLCELCGALPCVLGIAQDAMIPDAAISMSTSASEAFTACNWIGARSGGPIPDLLAGHEMSGTQGWPAAACVSASSMPIPWLAAVAM